MAKSQKFNRPVVMTRRRGFKRTEHDAKWLGDVIGAVKAGTPAELKGLPVAYHGTAPHLQDDLSAPIEARPSVIPAEPQDIPGTDDQVRKVDASPLPTAHGMKAANVGGAPSGTIPAKLGAPAAQPVLKP
jgi:hypothetical protein